MAMRTGVVLGWLVMFGLGPLGSGTARATVTPAISFQNGGSFGVSGYVLGYEFTVASNLSVTALGFYDNGSDGVNNSLVDNHEIGIFDAAGFTLVASNTVLTTDTLVLGDASNGYFVYHPLDTPVTLTTGVTYRIGAVMYGADDAPYAGFTGFATNANVILGPGAYLSSGSLVYPSSTDFANLYAAPNFLSEVIVQIPEPTAIALLGLGALLWAARRRRSR